MNEVKSFIIGFSLSILGASLYSQASPTIETTQHLPQQDIKISLFKDIDTPTAFNITHKVTKKNISQNKDYPSTTPISNNTIKNAQLIPSSDLGLIEGLEDDEIININNEDIIPIAFNRDSDLSGALPSSSNSNRVAILPKEATYQDFDTPHDSPWITAKGNLNSKNKLLPHNINNNIISQKKGNNDSFLPYNVAEKIKQSIIFPIPETILSDENLTPTFIKRTKHDAKSDKLQIINKEKIEKNEDNKNILDNITNRAIPSEDEAKKAHASPVYSSQTKTSNKAKTINNQIKQTKMKDVGDLYEAIQETKKQNPQKKILPSELKLTFNHNRAEISGQTLRWIRAFSEKTLNDGYYLKINLDTSTPTELQRKRLNLLYTILSSNGVDIDNIDTTFSQVGLDTFIIRLIKNN